MSPPDHDYRVRRPDAKLVTLSVSGFGKGLTTGSITFKNKGQASDAVTVEKILVVRGVLTAPL